MTISDEINFKPVSVMRGYSGSNHIITSIPCYLSWCGTQGFSWCGNFHTRCPLYNIIGLCKQIRLLYGSELNVCCYVSVFFWNIPQHTLIVRLDGLFLCTRNFSFHFVAIAILSFCSLTLFNSVFAFWCWYRIFFWCRSRMVLLRGKTWLWVWCLQWERSRSVLSRTLAPSRLFVYLQTVIAILAERFL